MGKQRKEREKWMKWVSLLLPPLLAVTFLCLLLLLSFITPHQPPLQCSQNPLESLSCRSCFRYFYISLYQSDNDVGRATCPIPIPDDAPRRTTQCINASTQKRRRRGRRPRASVIGSRDTVQCYPSARGPRLG